MTRSNSTPNPFTNELNSTTPSNNITNITSTEVPFDQLQHQPSTSTSTSLQDRRNSIKTTLPPNTKTNSHKTNHYQSFPRHSIHQINSQPIIHHHHHHHHHQSNSSTKSNSLNSNHQHIKIEPSSPKPNYSNGFLNSSSSSTTTSLTLHHDSSPASISFDKPSTISFLSDLISNDPLSSNHQPHKLNRYSLTSSPTVLSSSSVLRPTTTTTTTNITNTITTASPTALASSSNPMPTSPITSTSNSNSTSTNSSILNSNTSNPSTVTTPNTSLTTSTRAVPSRSNTLTVPLNHTANSITNNGRNPRGLRSSDGTNPSLQSSSSSSHPHPQQQQQVPPSPSPSRGEPSNGGSSTNAHTGQLEAKVVILGMQGVGKTSIVHRYTTGSFSYSLASTIGASFCTKKLSVDGCKVRLQIWDTAGQERFRSMAPMYYRGANAAILVYDITNQSSFEDIQNWLHELSANMSPELVIQIVGSKADLATDKRSVELEVAYQQILEWTESFPFQNQTSNQTHGRDVNHSWPDLAITEVSAKDDFGIEDMFLVVTRRLVMRKAEIEAIRLRKSRESILIEPRDSLNKSNQFHPSENGSSWCC